MTTILLALVFLIGLCVGAGIESSHASHHHSHDFYDYGENFTFIDRDGTSCALLFCGCGDTRKIELNAFDDTDEYRKEII